MQVMHVRPNRWRALPTILLIVGCVVLGTLTARAEGHAAHGAAASSSAAIR
jgi:hypothetical protein